MLEPYREDFNARFTAEKYAELLRELDRKAGTKVDFRVCETPCFFSGELLDRMVAAARELTMALVDNPEYMRRSDKAIPERYRAGNDNARPNFMTVDFGLLEERDSSVGFRLVELQAFPSVYAYQDLLARQYVETFGLAPELRWHLGAHDERSYWELLRHVIVGDHAPENVVLMELHPERQKTRADFGLYNNRLGVRTVDITRLRKDGRRLLYEHDGQWIAIERIFNRTIVDELEREGLDLPFSYRDELDVTWAGHPNWYFRASKFSLPFLEHPTVPRAVFLTDWLEDRSLLPFDREEILLKPLFSFAGRGIQFAPTDADLLAIPEPERALYLLQERVRFTPVIRTPHGMTQAEVRIMFVWPDDGVIEPVISLVRLGRGLMMGVDQNRNQQWVGGSAALFPQDNARGRSDH